MEKVTFPDFSGKVISMSVAESDCSHDLFDPHFENQCGRFFIVGTIPENCTSSNWSANQIGAVDWAKVRNYVLFANLDIYSKAVAISDAFHEHDNKS